ncbi:MAG: hypothetical protein FRX49_06135 [Trebouxia sp. A1-2]|nr:MAG: hypothetical protein FRX49_06135 [Trebouxia sp. A1-2]
MQVGKPLGDNERRWYSNETHGCRQNFPPSPLWGERDGRRTGPQPDQRLTVCLVKKMELPVVMHGWKMLQERLLEQLKQGSGQQTWQREGVAVGFTGRGYAASWTEELQHRTSRVQKKPQLTCMTMTVGSCGSTTGMAVMPSGKLEPSKGWYCPSAPGACVLVCNTSLSWEKLTARRNAGGPAEAALAFPASGAVAKFDASAETVVWAASSPESVEPKFRSRRGSSIASEGPYAQLTNPQTSAYCDQAMCGWSEHRPDSAQECWTPLPLPKTEAIHAGMPEH